MRLLSQSFGRFGRLTPAGVGNSEPYPGYDYYIDSVNGSDSNAGTSSAAAWATLGKLVTAGVLANGIKIGLARGSTWREQLDLTSYSDDEVHAYGSSSQPRPTIYGTNVASAAGWALTGGRTKAYDRSWSHSMDDVSYVILWNPDGTEPTWVSSAATCESTPNSYFVSNTLANPATVYYHPPGSTAPAEGVEITARNWCINAVSLVTGVKALRQGHKNGAIVCGTMRECIVMDGNVHNAWATVAEDCVFAKAARPTSRWAAATLWVVYRGTAGGDYVCRRCYAIGDGVAGVDGFYAHTSGGAAVWTSGLLDECYAYNVVIPFGAQDTTTWTVSNSFAERFGTTAFQMATNPAARSVEGYNVTLLQTSADGASPAGGGRLAQGAASSGVTDFEEIRWYSNNLASSGALFNGSDPTYAVRKSTFYMGGSSAPRIGFLTGAADSRFDNQNNIWYNFTQIFDFTNAAGEPDASDYNVLFPDSTLIDNKIKNTTYANWAAYRSAYAALDANTTITSDPLFSGTVSAGDFRLSGGTPADTGGRAAGSRLYIARPDWDAILANAEAGYLPWETVP